MSEQRFSVLRLGAISDGVFAIAMTLLILELKIPEMEAPVGTAGFREQLIGLIPAVVAWLISFVLLARLWISQYTLLQGDGDESRAFTTMNFVFLGVIAFIPFPSALIQQYEYQPMAVVVFSSVFALAGIVLGLLCYIKQSARSEPGKAWQDLAPSAKGLIVAMPLIGLASCFLAFWNTKVAVYIWLLLPLLSKLIKFRETKPPGTDAPSA